jgi:hypothetical protein
MFVGHVGCWLPVFLMRNSGPHGPGRFLPRTISLACLFSPSYLGRKFTFTATTLDTAGFPVDPTARFADLFLTRER